MFKTITEKIIVCSLAGISIILVNEDAIYRMGVFFMGMVPSMLLASAAIYIATLAYKLSK